ncbi:MAG: hypothetical protein RR547_08355 [Raoultibacter sp.]
MGPQKIALLNLISKVPDQVIAYICAHKSVPKKDYIPVKSIQNQRKKCPEVVCGVREYGLGHRFGLEFGLEFALEFGLDSRLECGLGYRFGLGFGLECRLEFGLEHRFGQAGGCGLRYGRVWAWALLRC